MIDMRRLVAVAVAAARPPIRDWRFWVVQLLVLAVAVGHEIADIDNFLTPLGIPSFATVGLFLVPIIYAALNFGLTGSVATATLVTVLSLPDFVIIHESEHHWVDGVQLAIIDAVAVFVGQRVERERLARQRAESARWAVGRAEARYRGLFEGSHAPILVVAADGRIREVNPAARQLLGEAAAGQTVADLLGVNPTAITDNQVDVIQLKDRGGDVRDLHPVCSAIETEDGSFLQIVLDDVTDVRRERERLSAFTAALIRAQEEERRRIGQEIHDQPLQTLIELYRRLRGAEAWPSGVAAEDTARAADTLDGVIAELRELARGLRPPALDDLGVVAALRRSVSDFGERNALEARFDVVGTPRRLPPEHEIALFRIAQEALRNVERHAAARNVRVCLEFANSHVRLTAEDDGIGFDVEPTRRQGRGLGLVGMQERAQLLGGRLEVHSRPDRGTTVVAELRD